MRLCHVARRAPARTRADRHQRGRDAFRVVTTTYIGGTEREALDRLVRDFGAEVRVQYDAARTRLHAKAWLFQRNTGFDTAYVGSSNLSTSALLEGVEWNVRLSTGATPSLMHKFRATFDSYWNSSEFEPYDPERDRDRLDDALNEASGTESSRIESPSLSPACKSGRFPISRRCSMHSRLSGSFTIVTETWWWRPRAPGRPSSPHWITDGFADRANGAPPSLLFVAHRKEILEQSLRTYREVLSDANFGELYVGGARPERWRHVFASVQSLHGYGVHNIPADAYDIVVIDEFHHAEAKTYRRLIDHFTPRELLGLTATPERADGTDVRSFFDGRTAAELRLWDALGADLLCPFHYFAIADGTDLRAITWVRGSIRRRAAFQRLHGQRRASGDRAEASCATRSSMSAPCGSRILRERRARGVHGACLRTRRASRARRQRHDSRARTRAPRCSIFASAASTFSSRPTCSTRASTFPTSTPCCSSVQPRAPRCSCSSWVAGFGVRRGKAVLTVLDFIGYHRKEFQFALRYRALTGATRREVESQVEKGFPFLPSGCQIVLDKQSQTLVLENIRSQIANRWQQIVAELRRHGDQELSDLPRRLRPRAQRHPATRQPLVDPARRDAGCSHHRARPSKRSS